MKKKFLGIPVVAMVSLALVLALVGSVAAFSGWFTFTTGEIDLTVDEAITVDAITVTDGSCTGNQAIGYIWTLSMYPGESETATVTITNHSTAALDVVTDVGSLPAGITVLGTGDISLEIPVTILGGATASFAIIVAAAGNVASGSHTINMSFQRQ